MSRLVACRSQNVSTASSRSRLGKACPRPRENTSAGQAFPVNLIAELYPGADDGRPFV
jgi:hypothetical protein